MISAPPVDSSSHLKVFRPRDSSSPAGGAKLTHRVNLHDRTLWYTDPVTQRNDDTDAHTGNRSRVVYQSDSVMTAVVPALLFGLLTVLAEPPWSAIEDSLLGYFLLTMAHFLPLFVLILPSKGGRTGSWIAMGLMSAAGVALCAHVGLSRLIVQGMDEGDLFSARVMMPILELFLSTSAVPAGLLVTSRFQRAGRRLFVLLTIIFAAFSQVLWFGAQRLWLGPSGFELWFASRIVVHCAMGGAAGFIASSFRRFRPRPYPAHWGGLTELIMMRLPSSLALAILLWSAVSVSAFARIVAEQGDRGRWITERIDDYFLSLTNLRIAEREGLAYDELRGDLERTRRTLLGAASFDPLLSSVLMAMLRDIEGAGPHLRANPDFRGSVMAVNRRLLSTGMPYFLEPHTLGKGGDEVRFLFRYRIVRRGRYGMQGGASVPMIRLRRMDGILVDNPYTGLSYRGIGTVLMDHVEDTALRSDAKLFGADAIRKKEEDGRFKETAWLLRQDRRGALVFALSSGNHDVTTLARLAVLSADIQPMIDLTNIRERMDVSAVAAYDRLTEILAQQTEIHEARHAMETGESPIPECLGELGAGGLSDQAASEIRAYLTEIVDGPLGPKFGLSTVGSLIIGENARANAYFFAAVTILEGLWGERIRRPDLVEREGESGTRYVFMPISERHPGWLSYSRIYGAYSDLSALPDNALRARARELFEELFGEEYRSIERRR